MLDDSLHPRLAARASSAGPSGRDATTGTGDVRTAAGETSRGAGAEGHIPLILLVEDNEFLAITMKMMLEGIGYRVIHAADAHAALDIIERAASGREGPIDLLFSDIVMPGTMNGLDLARVVRERMPTVPVILATGYASAAQDAIKEGFFLVNKPYPVEDLERLLAELLGSNSPAGG